MSKKKEVFVRLGFEDVILTKEEYDNFNGYVDMISEDDDADDPVIGSTEAYIIGYEFEDGTECNEDGTKL